MRCLIIGQHYAVSFHDSIDLTTSRFFNVFHMWFLLFLGPEGGVLILRGTPLPLIKLICIALHKHENTHEKT